MQGDQTLGSEEDQTSFASATKREDLRMEDLNLHILFFSVLLACAQSYIHISKPVTEEEVKCDETGSEEFSTWDWSPFENHASLPEVTKDIEPNFHLYRRGSILDHLVVLIHGFGSKKAVWAASMKEAIFENDPRENLAVLTVDWKKGASASFWDPIGSYNKAVANTRYIGVAALRLIQCLQKREKSHPVCGFALHFALFSISHVFCPQILPLPFALCFALCFAL